MAGRELRVAVLGDSAMWGQGLATEDKFALLAARRLADELDAGPLVTRMLARSGAKLRATADSRSRLTVRLPSGTTRRVAAGDRHVFYDTYPALFGTDRQALDFFAGRDEDVARRIFAEVPSTFPTIGRQIADLPAAVGAATDLVIIDGSVNDVGLQAVLDPLDGPSLDEIDAAIEAAAFTELKAVLAEARNKFPAAVIAVTGYYPPFSAKSDRSRMADMFRFMSERPGWQLWLNDILTSGFSRLFFPLVLLGELFGTEDIDALVTEAIRRAAFAHTRGLYWLRRAVAERVEAGDRRPGVYFVHPGFRPENALFATGTAFLHEGYRPPGEGDSDGVRDAALADRQARIPRRAHLSALRDARGLLTILALVPPRPPIGDLSELLRGLSELRERLDGPASLRDRLAEVVASGGDRAAAATARTGVSAEIARIEVAVIASFLHPNERGARRYADRIVARHARHRTQSVRDLIGGTAPSAPLSTRDFLRSYGLDPAAGLAAAIQHAVVDVLTVELDLTPLIALPGLDPDIAFPVFLRISPERRFRLDHPFGRLSVVDTFGDLRLHDITALALELGDGDGPDVARMSSLRLRINGRQVYATSRTAGLGTVKFDYPG